MSTENLINGSGDEALSAADRELEAALGSLKPSRAAASRDRLIFEAGRRAGRRPLVFWRSAAAMMAICAGVAVWRADRPVSVQPQMARSLPTTQTAPPEPPAPLPPRGPSGDQFAYLELRDRVLRDGVDSLPSSSTGGAGEIVPTLNPMRTGQP